MWLLLLLLLVTVVAGAGLTLVVVEAVLRLTSVSGRAAWPPQMPTLPSSNEVGAASDAESVSDRIPPLQLPPSSADDEAQLVFESCEALDVVLRACISHICSCRMSSW